jgi:hypothetical protein
LKLAGAVALGSHVTAQNVEGTPGCLTFHGGRLSRATGPEYNARA